MQGMKMSRPRKPTKPKRPGKARKPKPTCFEAEDWLRQATQHRIDAKLSRDRAKWCVEQAREARRNFKVFPEPN